MDRRLQGVIAHGLRLDGRVPYGNLWSQRRQYCRPIASRPDWWGRRNVREPARLHMRGHAATIDLPGLRQDDNGPSPAGRWSAPCARKAGAAVVRHAVTRSGSAASEAGAYCACRKVEAAGLRHAALTTAFRNESYIQSAARNFLAR